MQESSLDPDLLDALGLPRQSKQHTTSQSMPRESEKLSTGCSTNSETSSSCCSGARTTSGRGHCGLSGQPCMTVWPGRWVI